jgi:uncharacterized protein YuzB (UPF0349 family)
LQEAKALGKLLEDDIDCRIKRYSKCLSQCRKITASGLLITNCETVNGKKYREKIMNEPDEINFFSGLIRYSLQSLQSEKSGLQRISLHRAMNPLQHLYKI